MKAPDYQGLSFVVSETYSNNRGPEAYSKRFEMAVREIPIEAVKADGGKTVITYLADVDMITVEPVVMIQPMATAPTWKDPGFLLTHCSGEQTFISQTLLDRMHNMHVLGARESAIAKVKSLLTPQEKEALFSDTELSWISEG